MNTNTIFGYEVPYHIYAPHTLHVYIQHAHIVGIYHSHTNIKGAVFRTLFSHIEIQSYLEHEIARSFKQQLDEYTQSHRKYFDIPKKIIGGSNFQNAVWEYLACIPYGEVCCYEDIARDIISSSPQAQKPPSLLSRAVGTAVGSNPLSIVIPCHRVLTKINKAQLLQMGGQQGFDQDQRYPSRMSTMSDSQKLSIAGNYHGGVTLKSSLLELEAGNRKD